MFFVGCGGICSNTLSTSCSLFLHWHWYLQNCFFPIFSLLSLSSCTVDFFTLLKVHYHKGTTCITDKLSLRQQEDHLLEPTEQGVSSWCLLAEATLEVSLLQKPCYLNSVHWCTFSSPPKFSTAAFLVLLAALAVRWQMHVKPCGISVKIVLSTRSCWTGFVYRMAAVPVFDLCWAALLLWLK